MGQCVEFFYLSKKLQDKQKKQKEEENRDGEMQQQKNVRSSLGCSTRPHIAICFIPFFLVVFCSQAGKSICLIETEWLVWLVGID